MSFSSWQQSYKRWTITIDTSVLQAPPYRVTIRRPAADAEEPGEIGGDDQEQALTRARVKIDEIEAEAQSDR
jgi:hypothetical protein